MEKFFDALNMQTLSTTSTLFSSRSVRTCTVLFDVCLPLRSASRFHRPTLFHRFTCDSEALFRISPVTCVKSAPVTPHVPRCFSQFVSRPQNVTTHEALCMVAERVFWYDCDTTVQGRMSPGARNTGKRRSIDRLLARAERVQLHRPEQAGSWSKEDRVKREAQLTVKAADWFQNKGGPARHRGQDGSIGGGGAIGSRGRCTSTKGGASVGGAAG